MAHPRPPSRRLRPERIASLPAWGALCFFASGAAGLLYEVVWSKQLSYLLGSSLHAVATVVAAFLGGLALGARFLGTPLARREQGPRTYAALELGVALLGVISLPVLRAIEPLVGEMYSGFGGETTGFALARFALLFVLLVPPAALMGATLPVLVGHFERRRIGPAMARLYALNTFGAVAGSLLGGFALLPGFGLTATTWFAAAINVAVAVVAWIAGGRTAPQDAVGPATDPSAPEAPGDTLSPPVRTGLAILFALSGLAALAFQIAWVRLFTLVFGSSVYSFSAVLGVYLLGLALGSALVARLMSRGVSIATFARLQLALAAIAVLELQAFPRLPEWMLALASRSATNWGALFVGEVGLMALMLLVPCALLGAAFPIATRLLQRRDGGHAAGFAYAVNTLGTIAGSLIAGFFAVPNWGVQGTHLAAALLCLAIGLAAFVLARARREATGRDLAFAVVVLTAVSILAAAAPSWDPSLMSAGLYRPMIAVDMERVAASERGGPPPVWSVTRGERVLYYHEGVNGSVLVGTNDQTGNRWLRVGGKVDASTGDMDTQIALGLLPTALADSGARSLVIGLGSGATLAAVLAAGAGPTEVVEIERGVVEASRFFHGSGKDPLEDPRVRLIVGDARTQLAHGAGRYGLIVSEPSNPWIAGVNNLFTVDFYRRVKQRLEPDGVFCQWMQLYEISPRTFSSMIASFLEVFPEGHVFAVWRMVDLILVAVPDGRTLSLARLDNPEVRRLLEQTAIHSPEALAAYYAGPLSAFAPLARGAALNRDDRPIVEYRAPRDLITVGRAALSGDPAVSALVPTATRPPDGALFSGWSRDRWFSNRILTLVEQGEHERALTMVTSAEAAGQPDLARRLRAEIDSTQRRIDGAKEMQRSQELIAAGKADEARAALEHAVEIDPANGYAWVVLANQRMLAKDLDGALAALARVPATDKPSTLTEAALVAGMVEFNRERPLVAARHFREAQHWAAKDVRGYVLEARALKAAGDVAGARDAARRGLAAAPGDAHLTATLAELGGG